MIPTIKLVAYGSRDPNKVFVAVPNELARYVLTDRCVVERGCGVCKAQVGEPCNNGNGKYWSGTHADRRGYNPRGRQRPGTPTEPQDHIATERDWILI